MSGSQNIYSYDVPTTFIDFSSFNADDHNVDSWFDQVTDVENVPPAPDQNIETPGFGNPLQIQADESVMNLSGGNSKKRQKTPKTQSRRSSKRLSAQQRIKQMAKIRAEKKKVTPKQEEHPPSKRQKLSAAKCKSTDTTINKELATSVAEGSPKFKPKLLPTTPTVLKRKTTSSKLKNSEEQELEKMQQLQQELFERLKKNEESLKLALAGAGQPLKKISVQATKPVDFHFCTDDRIKRHQEESTGDQYKQVDFTAGLRKHPPSPARMPKGGRTVPKPFNLSQGNKRKHEETTTGEYLSTAEQVMAFCKRTPQRFHLRSRQKEIEGPSPVIPVKLKLTHPKTPQLQTKQRQRAVTCKSTAELEAEELEKQQQYKFKAQELNTKMLEGGAILPKKPQVKEPTKAIGFNLEIEKRIQQREKKDEEEEETFTFHSKPCPTKILTDVVGVPGKKALPVTVPQSPAFALRNKVRVQWNEMKEETAPIIKANPVPHYGVPFKPKLEEQRQVEVCPFSFSERDQHRMEIKEKKLDQLRQAEVPKFRAQPLPHFDCISLPEKKVKLSTQQEPFDLQIDKRGESKLQRWKQQVKDEQKQQKEMSMFKARPNTVTYQEPFVPKKDSRIIESLSGSIVQEGFELATERRAKERQEFEKRLVDLETQKCLLEEEERRRQEEQEKEEINQLRHELVHKAHPIRKFKQVVLKSSDARLTVPKTPNFSDRFKI